MKETLLFYAPDRELLLIWCVIALVSCVLVLWMGGIFGRRGLLVTTAIVVAGALALWLSVGPEGYLYLVVAFALPLAFGALIGTVVWYVWSSRRWGRL